MNKDIISRLTDFLMNEARSCSMDFGCVTPQYVFPSLLHFFTATDTQQVMKREPIFPQHFHNNFICWEAKGNKALRMAFKTL